jgi:hypothetical protein
MWSGVVEKTGEEKLEGEEVEKERLRRWQVRRRDDLGRSSGS